MNSKNGFSMVMLSALFSFLVFVGCADKESNPQNQDNTPLPEKTEKENTGTTEIISENQQEVKAALQEIFRLVNKGEFEKVSDFIVYKGPDTTRTLSDVMHWQNKDDRYAVETTCQVIKIWLESSDANAFGTFREEPMGDQTLYVQEVIFTANGQKDSRDFAFLIIEGKPLLYNIK